MNEYVPWLTLALLGAYHGINPAVGWLFAVALGLQERSRAAVVRAFAPIALGHAASIAVMVAVVAAAQTVVSPTMLRVVGASALVLFGFYKLLAPMSHPRWVGMRVNFRDLTMWSFLMATAHGAGLMLVPILLQLPNDASSMTHGAHAEHTQMVSAMGVMPAADIVAVVIHTAAMFLVMGVIALVVYEKIGLAILRRAWFNLDRIWAGALIGAGALTFLF
ncbi:MAG: hypothetical protein M3220_17435 [Chloroflexota bacterium]|nr:hypothetical protein [Chloroflexota bacterium]